jgi:hypothetical protein
METTALTTSSAETGPTTNTEPRTCASLVVTTSEGHFEQCANPFCDAVIEPLNHGRHRRTPRRFCSDACRYDLNAAKRVKRLMDRVGIIRFYELLDRV